jgi:translation initiation factor 3 subunit J
VLESWDAEDDSEVEREKARKAAEAKAKAEADARAKHKTKTQRIAEHQAANAQRRQQAEEEESSEEEDESTRRARLRKSEKDSDLRHAEDLFGNLGISNNRAAGKHITLQSDPNDPTDAIDLSRLKLFDPNTKEQFATLRETLVPLISKNAKKAQYTLFMQEFAKQICKDLPSDQIKKIASGLTTLSNEKMKEEKAVEKGGKKTKAAKTKTSLSAARDISHKADTTVYDDLDE